MSNSNFFNASNLEKRIYNYNEYTKNIEHWNPYIEKLEISFFENKKNYFILGPENELGLKYLWKFDLGFNNNKLVLSSIETTKESNPCIKISIKNKIGYIDYINSCGDYRGKDITEWMIQIIKNLDCKKCILIDNASKNCNGRNFKYKYVPISLIHKLWRGNTYYEQFYFIPYSKNKNNNNNNNSNNRSDELNGLIQKLKTIKWNDFSIDNEKWNKFKKDNSMYPSPFDAFKEFDPSHCAIFYDIFHYLDSYEQPSSEILSKIKNIISKSKWIKVL